MIRRALAVVPFLLLALILPLAAQQQAAPPAAAAAAFDEGAAAGVLGTLRDGLESHSQRRLLSAFEAGKMDGYLAFEDQIDAYFARYEGFRATFRILQISEENQRGVILAEFQVENEPPRGGRSSRREGQLRFELERGAKGWKIVDLNPRDFFLERSSASRFGSVHIWHASVAPVIGFPVARRPKCAPMEVFNRVGTLQNPNLARGILTVCSFLPPTLTIHALSKS